MPKKYFVTRHRGAITWAAQGGARARKVESENFDVATIAPGDIVMGTLPVHLAAEVNARGGHYWHLSMDIPPDKRGKELSADEMREYGARLEEFQVNALGQRSSELPDVLVTSPTELPLHCCIASEQILANALPLLALSWKHVVIFASPKVERQAQRLQAFADSVAQSRNMPTPACTIVPIPQTADWEKLRAFAKQASVTWSGTGAIDFNLTGGTKLMSFAFHDAFRSRSRKLYCSTQDDCLDILDTIKQENLPLNPDLLNIPNYLKLQGYQITRKTSVENSASVAGLMQREALTASMILAFDALSRHTFVDLWLYLNQDNERYNTKNLLGMLHHIGSNAVRSARVAFRPHVRIEGLVFHGSNPTSKESETSLKVWKGVFNALQDAHVIENLVISKAEHPAAAQDISFSFVNEDAAKYLGGGYLEEYVFHCLHALELPAQNYAVGVGIGQATKSVKQANDEMNELDAVAVWKNRLLVIECKAGVQLFQEKSQQDILNKLDQLKDNVGGSMGLAWLVTPRQLDPTIQAHADVSQRADAYNIRVLSGQQAVEKLGKTLAQSLGCKVKHPWPSPDMVLAAFRKPKRETAPKPKQTKTRLK